MTHETPTPGPYEGKSGVPPAPKVRRTTRAEKDRACELYLAGESQADISRATGISRPILSKMFAEMRLDELRDKRLAEIRAENTARYSQRIAKRAVAQLEELLDDLRDYRRACFDGMKAVRSGQADPPVREIDVLEKDGVVVGRKIIRGYDSALLRDCLKAEESLFSRVLTGIGLMKEAVGEQSADSIRDTARKLQQAQEEARALNEGANMPLLEAEVVAPAEDSPADG